MAGTTPAKKKVIRKAQKQARQALKRRDQRAKYTNQMKSLLKLMKKYFSAKDSAKAAKMLPQTIRIIDICAKKRIIHKKNAANKKSGLQKALNKAIKAGPAPVIEKKAEKPVVEKVEKPVKDSVTEKTPKKKVVKKEKVE